MFGLDSIVSSLGGGLISGIGSIFAAKKQQQAVQNANNGLQTSQNTIANNQSPYTTAGADAISTINNDEQNGTGFAKAFSMKDFYSDPGYQFTLQQGQNAINNSAAAKGGLLSGAAAKGLASYSSGLANQTYLDAYNRYLSTRQQGYNELAGTANLGQSATQNVNNSQLQTGFQQAQNTIGAGNAAAAGIVGATNAVGSSLTNLGQYYALQNLGLGGNAGSKVSSPIKINF